jgi:hypothetical protein
LQLYLELLLFSQVATLPLKGHFFVQPAHPESLYSLEIFFFTSYHLPYFKGDYEVFIPFITHITLPSIIGFEYVLDAEVRIELTFSGL